MDTENFRDRDTMDKGPNQNKKNKVQTTTLYETNTVNNNGASVSTVSQVISIEDDIDDEEEEEEQTVLKTNTNNDPFIMPNKRRNEVSASARRTQKAKRGKVVDIHALPLTNRFAVFNSNAAHTSSSIGVHGAAVGGTQAAVQSNKPKRPPPIVITNSNYDAVKAILNDVNVIDYSLKITAIGLKIQCDSHESAKKLGDHLKNTELQHFSHKERDSKIFRAVMYGLPHSDINEICEDLKKFNVTPIDIIELNTSAPNSKMAIYVVNFNRGEVSMPMLNNIRAVLHVCVRWAPYSPKYRGPTQCRNCTMYGHGGENCHRKPICTFCASSEHKTSACPMNEPHARNSTAAGRPIFKCHFCTINKLRNDHAANDENCPARMHYLNIRQNVNSRKVKPQAVARNVPNSSVHRYRPISAKSNTKFTHSSKCHIR